MDTTNPSFVNDLVAEVGSLPSVAARIVSLTSDPHCELKQLEQTIATDGAMTLRFLALANSASFSRGREVRDLRTALVRLGLNRVRNVALLMGAHDLFPADTAVAGLDPQAFWHHSLGTACWARQLAGQRAEDAWLTGILHGIGVPALARHAPAELASCLALARRESVSLAAAETRILGHHHGQTGAAILARWKLPQDLCDVVSAVPAATDEPATIDAELVAAVRAGAELARACGLGENGDGRPLPDPAVAALGAGIAADDLADLVAAVDTEVADLSRLLGTEQPRPTRADVIEAAGESLARLGLQGVDESLVRQQLEDQMAQAREIQQRLLPRHPPDLAGYLVAASNRPSLHVGGDLFDFVPAVAGTACVVADVTDKGLPAALLAANLQATIRALAPVHADPARLVQAVSESLLGATDPERFATLFLAVASPDHGQLACVGAGHVPPLHWRPGTGATWLRPGGPPVGMVPGASYRADLVAMAPGDLLVVCTDGVVEATDADGREFGAGGVEQVVAAHAADGAAGVLAAIEKAVLDHAAAAGSAAEPPGGMDDLTLLVLCRTSSAGRTGHP